MKVYVAASFTQKDDVREIYEMLREDGHEISSDWTAHSPIRPYDQNREMASQYAANDMDGVDACDVFVLLADSSTISTGKHAELGGAIMSRKLLEKPQIYIVGENLGESIFYFHPSVNIRKSFAQVREEIRTR